MYNLKTFEGRIKAIADGMAVAINTEPNWHGVIVVSLITLADNIHWISNLSYSCSLSVLHTFKPYEWGEGEKERCADKLRDMIFGNSPRLTLQREGV